MISRSTALRLFRYIASCGVCATAPTMLHAAETTAGNDTTCTEIINRANSTPALIKAIQAGKHAEAKAQERNARRYQQAYNKLLLLLDSMEQDNCRYTLVARLREAGVIMPPDVDL